MATGGNCQWEPVFKKSFNQFGFPPAGNVPGQVFQAPLRTEFPSGYFQLPRAP